MREKASWQRRIEPAEHVQAGRRGCIDGAVLMALVVALAVAAARVMVSTDRWQCVRYHLPGLAEARRIILSGESPKTEDPNPPGVPTPPLPAPRVMPEQPLLGP